LAGLLLLLATVALYLSQSVMGDIRVDDSFSATAANVLSRQTAYRWVFAINLIGVALTVAAVTLLDELLRPVSARLSRFAALIAFVGCVVQAVLDVLLYGARELVHGIPYRDAFYTRQVQALAHLLLNMYRDGCFIALVFFGLYAIAIAYVTAESLLLPTAVILIVAVFAVGFTGIALVFPDAVLGSNWRRGMALNCGGLLTLSIALLALGLNPERWKQAAALPARLVA
jgi:hypothetical protein